MNLDKAFYNTFIKPILELDEQMTKLRIISNVSEEKYNETLNEVKEIAATHGCTVSGILGSISSGLMYGYSIDYVMDKVRNNQPIRNPFENFKSVYDELYKTLKWYQKLWLWIYDKWDCFKGWIRGW